MGGTKLWTRTFIVLMAVNFCSALSFYLIMVKITEFAMDTYQVSHSVAGLMVTAYVISALVTRVVFGGRIDRWGVKRALAIGSVVNAAAMALYLVPMPFGVLMSVRVVHGFGFAIMSGSAAAGAALVIPRERYGEGIGYFSMMQALATGVGPFIAIFATNAFGRYDAMFALATAFAVLAAASLVLLDIPHVEGAGDAGPQRDGRRSASADDAGTTSAGDSDGGTPSRRGGVLGFIGSFVQLSVVPLGLVLLLCYVGYSGILSFLTLCASERGLSHVVSLYFVVYAAVILVSRPPVGRKVDRSGENSIIYWCFLSLAAGFTVLAFAESGVMLLASAALVGFGIGATQSITQAVIARDTPAGELGRANSTFFMSMDLGSGVGPIIIGALIPVIGFTGSYLALGALGLAAGVLYHIVHGRKKPGRR